MGLQPGQRTVLVAAHQARIRVAACADLALRQEPYERRDLRRLKLER